MNGATPTTQDTPDKGRLQINLVSDITAYPIQGARISISYTGIPETPLEQLTTDSSGQTDMIDLAAPPLEYSLDPENEIQPYSEYTLQISAAGYESVSIAGTEILPHVTALQNVSMKPVDNQEENEAMFVIPAHTLYATYPPKIPEDEIKPTIESGEIVLSRVVVPEYIVVHDGNKTNISYDYMCCDDTQLFQTHILDKDTQMPECSKMDCNYYVANGMYYTQYDAEQALGAMNQTIWTKKSATTFKFSDNAVYQQAHDDIFQKELAKAAQNLADYYGLSQVKYQYIDDPRLHKIVIFWQYS